MSEEYPRICHVYAQGAWHDDARIVGTSSALAALSRAIGWVLSTLDDDPPSLREHRVPVFAADGEGYNIVVERDDGNWDSWVARPLPYTDPATQGIVSPERARAEKAETLLADIYTHVCTGSVVYADGYWCYQEAFDIVLDRLRVAVVGEEPVG